MLGQLIVETKTVNKYQDLTKLDFGIFFMKIVIKNQKSATQFFVKK